MSQEKYPYLPVAAEGPGPVAEEAPVLPGRYPCPCCGHVTFPVPKEEAVAFICPECFWENDVFDPGEDSPSDENRGLTLRQGRENYKKFGVSNPRRGRREPVL